MELILIIESIILSTVLYLYLNYKANVSLKFLYKDNIVIIFFSAIFSLLIYRYIVSNIWIGIIGSFCIVPFFIIVITLIRFYRSPKRSHNAKPDEILSAADGQVIYIEEIEADTTPISIKKEKISKLEEITKTDLLNTPCWLIGIEMTPFDVHKNAVPIDGRIKFQQHFHGKFLSLRLGKSDVENERCTTIFENKDIQIGVVQIASRKVRRILSYYKQNDLVKKGVWYGMITFGSQADMIIPKRCKIKVRLKQQVFAGKTIVAADVKKDK